MNSLRVQSDKRELFRGSFKNIGQCWNGEFCMAKLMKWVLGIIAAIVVLAGLAIAAITLWIDPNSFKPEIEAAAKKQGIILSLKGDLAWQFFPDVGMVINEVSVATTAEPATPMATIQHAALSVAVMPLFYGSVKVDGIILEGADIKLHINSDGVANWSQLMAKDKTQAIADTPEQNTEKLAVSIEELAISNSQISYKDDKANESISLTGFSLQGTDIVMNGEPFALATAGKFQKTDALQQQQSGQFDVKASVSVDEAMTVVSLKDAAITLALNTAAQQQNITITLQMTAQIPADKQPMVINSLVISNGEISILDTATQQSTQVSKLAMDVKNIRIESEPASAISVASLAISNADVSLIDNVIKKTTAVSNVVVNAQTLTLDNQPFPFNMKATVLITQPETPELNAKVDLNGKMAVDETQTHITLSDSKLLATVGADKLQETLTVLLDMAVTTEPFAYQGIVDIATFNASRLLTALGTELPVMQSPTALHKVALKAKVTGADNSVRMESMVMQMDETAFSGNVAITNIEKSILDIKLHGNQINADNYLEPVAEVSAAQSAAPVDENAEIIPVETLRGLAMDVDVTFDELTIKKLPLTHFSTVVAAHNGLLEVKKFTANLYDKPLQVFTTIDARNPVPAIQFDIAGSDLPLGELLRDFDIEEHVSGNSDFKAVGNTNGIRKNELMRGLNATVEMTGKQFQVSNINIEQTVCDFIAKAEQKTPIAQA